MGFFVSTVIDWKQPEGLRNKMKNRVRGAIPGISQGGIFMKKNQMIQEESREIIFKKSRILDGVILAAGVCAMACFGLTAQASVPEGIWEYTTGTDEDGNIFCDFKEVEVTIPGHWGGKCGISRGEDYVSFYHLASREAIEEEGWGTGGGLLFTLCWSEDYEFTDYLPSYRILGEGDYGVYYVELPTDVQGYMDDGSIWTEWLSLAGNVDWIVDHIVVTPYGDSYVDYTDIDTYSNAEEYILPESSAREIKEEELQGLDYNDLQMAINEIYARHHRKFVMEGVQSYFNSKSWYTGTIEAAAFDPATLSQTEWKNIELMLKLMDQRK